MSHRDTVTRLNGSLTSRVQAEVYKIGDSLIHQQGLELLLPEGFFRSKTPKVEVKAAKAEAGKAAKCAEFSDMNVLLSRLGDNRTYVNAEMLLKEGHPIQMEQVEDEPLYFTVRDCILKLVKTASNSCDYPSVKSELAYLQDRRTAAILQNVPEIIDGEFQHGKINEKRGVLTIGMSHIPKIIQYLNDRQIRIPHTGSDKGTDYVAEVNLLKENFGVTIIIPKTLAEDHNTLVLNGMDKIIAQSRIHPSEDSFARTKPY